MMTKEKFKILVKEACRKKLKKAFKFLMEEKEKVSSKMGKLRYSELAMQNYLSTQELSTSKKKLLFLLRVRMLKIPNNMGQRNLCRLCQDENTSQLDNQEHLLLCSKIRENLSEIDENDNIKYDHIYETDIQKVKPAINLLQKAIRTRKLLLSDAPSAP